MVLILSIIYFVLASTIGAYYLTINDSRIKGDITLLDVMGHIFPAIILSWFLFIGFVLGKIVVKKRS